MAFNDKYHINPATGAVSKCSAVVGECPFGGLDHHFRDETDARRAFEAKAQFFHDWTSRSNVPQKEGWITEHVFDPSRPETYHNHLVWLVNKVPTGTQMVIENGWVFKKLNVGSLWELIEGEERVGGIKKGIPVGHYQFLSALENFGGRMEFRDGVQPMKINWRM